MIDQEVIRDLLDLNQRGQIQASRRTRILSKKYDLNETCIMIVRYLLSFPEGLEPNKIAFACGVQAQTLTLPLHNLEDSGYLVKGKHPSDKRKVVITLTQKGQEIAKEMRDDAKRMNEIVSAHFSDEELKAFVAFRKKAMDEWDILLTKVENGLEWD